MMGLGSWSVMGGFGGLWMVMPMLFWVGLVVLVVWAAGQLFSGREEGRHETALEALKRRYASGEISAAEYQQAKSNLD